MTEPQAQALIAQIQAETDAIDTSLAHVRNGAYGWSVKLTLRPAQLVLSANFPDDWPSIKGVWYSWLPGIRLDDLELVDQRHRHPRYMVDGINMAIWQRGDGYWCGRAWVDSREIKRFFGKSDPRGKYQLVEKEEASA
jgi:hypothetical protein